MITIRKATPADAPAIAGMVRHFLEASPYGRLLGALQPDILLSAINKVMGGAGVVFVADDEAEHDLVGLLALVAGQHHVSGEWIAEELVWWVEPDHRRGRVGPSLLSEAERWCLAAGVRICKMVAPEGNPAVGRWLDRHGYQRVEAAYAKRF